MFSQEILERYISICRSNLEENYRALSYLKKHGIYERFIFDNFRIGYADGNLLEILGENAELVRTLSGMGVLIGRKEALKSCITIPVLDENKAIENIVGFSIFPQSKKKIVSLNEKGIFNSSFLRNSQEAFIAENPIDALFLVQNEVPNATFVFGPDQKYNRFLHDSRIRRIIFTFEGRAKLFHELSKNGVSAKRLPVDFEAVDRNNPKEALASLLNDGGNAEISGDAITEIENGFIFRFAHISYRIIGNFSEHSMNMKVNAKAFTEDEAFVDSLDLYKNRDRQNFTFNLMDKFSIRDQVQLENDLNQIIQVIERHKERKEKEKKRIKPELTEYQRDIGLRFLQNPDLLDEIDADYTQLGCVREQKNKILLYLVMTSRLMENPLHTILISRSGAGKSQLVEITESLCPPEDVESVSDLSPMALYYFGKDDLKNRFIVIGEKQGSESSDYPLRELITKKSITKALPMKDPISGEIKTVSIRVNGPISLAETTTNGEVNPENLNRCFVIGIDESQEQTRLIHQMQRQRYTLAGYLSRCSLHRIREKHIFVQRLLKPILVFNPYAEQLAFPSSKLKTRRDNDKFLRLISVICFLHQYQRKRMRLDGKESVEYIECTPYDYKVAYELLSDGVLDSTLDDLPRPARKLLDIIKKYLSERSERDGIPTEKIIFERKEIREYSSWSFAQVRNNFRILRDYEYIHLIKANNGLANQYRLSGTYSDLNFLGQILSPQELENKIAASS